jgi:hypothetical protein
MNILVKPEDCKVTITETDGNNGRRTVETVQVELSVDGYKYNTTFPSTYKPRGADFQNFARMLEGRKTVTLTTRDENANSEFELYYEHNDLKFWVKFDMKGEKQETYIVIYGKYGKMLGLNYPRDETIERECRADYNNITDAEKDFAKLVAIDSRFTFANIMKLFNNKCFVLDGGNGLRGVRGGVFVANKLDEAYDEFLFDQAINK